MNSWDMGKEPGKSSGLEVNLEVSSAERRRPCWPSQHLDSDVLWEGSRPGPTSQSCCLERGDPGGMPAWFQPLQVSPLPWLMSCPPTSWELEDSKGDHVQGHKQSRSYRAALPDPAPAPRASPGRTGTGTAGEQIPRAHGTKRLTEHVPSASPAHQGKHFTSTHLCGVLSLYF